MRKLAIAAILALSCLSIASAKSYEIALSAPTKAGSVQLNRGTYRVKINGSNAIFTDLQSSESFTVPVKVEATDKKFEETRVDATKDNGTDVIKDIELGGSKTKIEFTY